MTRSLYGEDLIHQTVNDLFPTANRMFAQNIPDWDRSIQLIIDLFDNCVFEQV